MVVCCALIGEQMRSKMARRTTKVSFHIRDSKKEKPKAYTG